MKTAEQILRKNPKHGETLAMKALIINSQGRTEEAFVMAKEALRYDMKSHVCWHVYGLLYRTAKNYEEAIKAYKFALKLEPDSPNIQRDLALLQIQMRDYSGYIASRKSMLQARSGQRQYWTALAVANHLAGNLKAAEGILTTYEDTLKSPPSKTDLEHSEAVLYKNTIIAELGETQRALEHLETIAKHNLDRTAVLELKADYLLKLGKNSEAEKAYRSLIHRNPENRTYFLGLEKALGAEDNAGRKAMKPMYDEYAEKNPRGDAARRIPLDFLEGDDFRQAADTYLRRLLTKGIPSTFANIKALYSNPAKRDTIHDLVKGYSSEDAPQANGSAEEPSSNPSTTTTNGDKPSTSTDHFPASVLYFLAQHYNYHLSRDLPLALSHISRAIDLSPQSVDYHMTLARIHKHLGNPAVASTTMTHARTLDERDRYINTKAAKYQLRNNDNADALATMSKFTRNETAGGPLGDLHEMQCVWFLTEDGEAYARQGRAGMALKRFHALSDIFDVWHEDQFDFHSFSLKKGQIRAYVDMVRWEDHLRQHPFFARVALDAIAIYLRLSDHPHLAHEALANGAADGKVDFANLDDSERKKAIKKAKREQQKAADAARRKEDAERDKKKTGPGAGANTADATDKKKEDDDPTGAKLAQTPNPLGAAMRFLTPLLEFSPKLIKAHTTAFEVYVRRSKPHSPRPVLRRTPLTKIIPQRNTPSRYGRSSPPTSSTPQTPRCTSRPSASNTPVSAALHPCLSLEMLTKDRGRTVDRLPTPLPPALATALPPLLATLLPNASTSLQDFTMAFRAAHAESAAHVLASLRARHLLADGNAGERKELEDDVAAVLAMKGCGFSDARAGLDTLQEWGIGKEGLDAYKAKAKTSRGWDI